MDMTLGMILYDSWSGRSCMVVAGAQAANLVTVQFADGEVTSIYRNRAWPL